MERTRTALVLGATGGIGGEVATALLRHGWTVRALQRDPAQVARRNEAGGGIAWLTGDAMRPADVAGAAAGAERIVQGVNPPGYRNWAQRAVPMLDSSIAAARASGARVVLPGTVYNYGPEAFPLLAEDSPQHPRTRKGAIRVEMERHLRDAAEGGVGVLIVRAGDFFGPHTNSSWFSQALVKPGRPVRSVANPGRRGVGHSWAFLPDLAETMVRLAQREGAREAFERFHFAGHWDPDGTAMAAAIGRAAGQPKLRARRFPWPLLVAASPFVTFLREMMEMRYLWREPLRLDNRRLIAALGAEPHTPLDQAVRRTLAGLGCLSEPGSETPSRTSASAPRRRTQAPARL